MADGEGNVVPRTTNSSSEFSTITLARFSTEEILKRKLSKQELRAISCFVRIQTEEYNIPLNVEYVQQIFNGRNTKNGGFFVARLLHSYLLVFNRLDHAWEASGPLVRHALYSGLEAIVLRWIANKGPPVSGSRVPDLVYLCDSAGDAHDAFFDGVPQWWAWIFRDGNNSLRALPVHALWPPKWAPGGGSSRGQILPPPIRAVIPEPRLDSQYTSRPQPAFFTFQDIDGVLNHSIYDGPSLCIELVLPGCVCGTRTSPVGAGRVVHESQLVVKFCWGLCDPAAPHAVSLAQKRLKGPTLKKLLDVCNNDLGLAFDVAGPNEDTMKLRTRYLPVGFPPPLHDAEARFQESPFGDATEAAEFVDAELRRYGLTAASLLALTDQEFEQALDIGMKIVDAEVQQMVELGCCGLRMLRARAAAVQELVRIYRAAVDRVLYANKIKDEQELIASRWDREPDVAKKKSKNKRKRAAQAKEESGAAGDKSSDPTATEIVDIVREVLQDCGRKTIKFRHYRQTLNTLANAGVLESLVRVDKRGSHFTLHGEGVNSVTLVRPHGSSSEHRSGRILRGFRGMEKVQEASAAGAGGG